jgi:hypothetical protein
MGKLSIIRVHFLSHPLRRRSSKMVPSDAKKPSGAKLGPAILSQLSRSPAPYNVTNRGLFSPSGIRPAASSAPFVATFASIPFSSQAICHDGSCIGATGDVHVVHADRTQRELRQSMSNGDGRQQHTFPTEHCIHLQDFETSNHGMLVVPADRWRISRRAARSTGG